MPKKKKAPRLTLGFRGGPGYSFKEMPLLTEASKSTLQHLLKSKVIRGSINDADGKGNFRRFATADVIELQISADLNKHNTPVPTIEHALWTFRGFRRGAIAIYEHVHKLPLATAPELAGMFKDDDDRHMAAERFLRMQFIGNDSMTQHIEPADFKRIKKASVAIGEFWHRLQTSSLLRGTPDPELRDLCYLIISKEADHNYRDVATVRLNPTPGEWHDAIERSATVVDIVGVVWQVGQRAARNWINLEPW